MNGLHLLLAVCIAFGIKMLYDNYRQRRYERMQEFASRRYEPTLPTRKPTEADGVGDRKLRRLTEKEV